MNNITKANMYLLNFIEHAGSVGISRDELRKKLFAELGFAIYNACFGRAPTPCGGDLSTRLDRILEHLSDWQIERKYYSTTTTERYVITANGLTELIKLKREAIDADLERLNKRLLELETPKEKEDWQLDEALNGRR